MVDAPRCGVATSLSLPNRMFSVAGSVWNTSSGNAAACSPAATLSALGLVRASATGTSSGTPPVGQPLDDRENQTSLCSLATARSAAPTAGTIYLRQFQAAAVQGSGVIWTWPADAPLVVDAASQLLLWNFGVGAASALSVYFRWRE